MTETPAQTTAIPSVPPMVVCWSVSPAGRIHGAPSLAQLHGFPLPETLDEWNTVLPELAFNRLFHFVQHALEGAELDVLVPTGGALRHRVVERQAEGGVTLHTRPVHPEASELSLDARTRLNLASEVADLGFWSIDGRSGACTLDHTTRRLLGLPLDQTELSLQGVLDLGGKTDQEVLWSLFLQQLSCGHPPFDGVMESDIQVDHPDEGRSHLHIRARVLGHRPPESQQVVGVLCRSSDTSAPHRMLPLHQDTLTGLPNRRYFLDRLRQHLHLHQHSTLSCAVLLLDLDRFKDLNARYGTHTGDQVLCQVAAALKEGLRSTDVLARLGGDSFAVLLTGLKETETVTLIVERILNSLPAVELPGTDTLQVQGTVGVALYPQDSGEAHGLLACAEDALSSAKQQARSRYVFFEKQFQQDLLERQELTRHLAVALQENQLEVYYQPMVDAHTAAVHKAEALLRWKHPERGFVSPAVFIPIAEETGLIHQLGRWVSDTVMEQLAQWDREGLPEVSVSINLSARQFVQPGTIPRLLEQMQQHGLAPHRIIVEITESVFLQDQVQVEQQFKLLEAAGVRIALDDFGTGYSSLSYLARFNPHFIKIDRSFVQQLENLDTSTIIEAIISMGHHLKKEVVAEGVETGPQSEWLKARNCQYLQGYLFSRPVPAADFVRLLQQGR